MIAPNSWVEIDRTALFSNVHTCRRLIGPRCRLLALVKGNAYGHGLQESAQVLLEAGVDMLGVEAVGEAVALRTAGITSPILLVGPIPTANFPSFAHQFTLLGSPEQVQIVGEFTRQAAVTSTCT